MDLCTLAAHLIATCASEAAIATQPGSSPGVMVNQKAKSYEVAPSARAANPEIRVTADAAPAQDCPQVGTVLRYQMGCAPSSLNVSRTMAELEPRFSYANRSLYPVSGDQFFAFRTAALRAGELYTRASPQRYQQQWQQGTTRATYEQWKALLAQEATVMAQAQGQNRLTVLVGDSLSLWLPIEQLPRNRFWLNQSISGETTAQILRRLNYFRATRPDQIQVMAGINDLKNGASDREVVSNTQQILAQLRQHHPQAELVVYSILPTRLGNLPSDRIRRVNTYIAYVAQQQGATFVDLQTTFADPQGLLRRDLTTDGLHLSRQGYDVWQAALVGI